MGLLTWRSSFLSFGYLALAACGSTSQTTANHRQNNAAAGGSSEDAQALPRLALDSTDQVLGTLVIPFGDAGAQLTDSTDGRNHWTVDMQDSLPVVGGVAPLKYLKVTGDLHVPQQAASEAYDIGCIYVNLKDNVYYREKTWLRLATRGIKGTNYKEISLPMSVDLGGWKEMPTLDDSVTIAEFSGDTIKKFNGTLCFKLDFSNAPADQYKGDIIVQYLRPGTSVNPPACTVKSTDPACLPDTTPPTTPPTPAPIQFACASEAPIVKAGGKATLSWKGVPSGSRLQLMLASDTPGYAGSLGSVINSGATGATYTAPASIPANARIVVTAHAVGSELLPAYCAVQLTADGQIGVPDDGETLGLPGNVYVLPSSTVKLPDFSKLKPVMELIVANIDVPNHTFTQGFPGIPNLTEWFGIQFRGQIIIPSDQTCSFKVSADDGANLYIDDQLVVNNDGIHPVADAYGTVSLKAGSHKFKVDYYQGPRTYIALQTFWKCGDAAAHTIIPSTAFARPLK